MARERIQKLELPEPYPAVERPTVDGLCVLVVLCLECCAGVCCDVVLLEVHTHNDGGVWRLCVLLCSSSYLICPTHLRPPLTLTLFAELPASQSG